MAINRVEQCSNNVGGISELYIFEYVKYARSLIKVENNFLVTFPYSVVYNLNANQTSFTENVDEEDGGVVYTQNGNFQLNKVLSIDNYKNLVAKDWRIIIKDNNNNYRLIGLETGVKLKFTKEIGTNLNDFNGFKFSFETKEENTSPFIKTLSIFNIIDTPDNQNAKLCKEYHYLGNLNTSPITSNNIISLDNSVVVGDKFTLNIPSGTQEVSFYVATENIVSVIDLGNLNINLTNDFAQSNVVLNNIIYTKNTIFLGHTGFLSDTVFQVTIADCKAEFITPNTPPNIVVETPITITLPTNSFIINSTITDSNLESILWTQVNGANTATIINGNTETPTISNLIVGNYTFKVTATDTEGLFSVNFVNVEVKEQVIPKQPPIANAGSDKTFTLPTNTAILNGVGSTDPQGSQLTYLWTTNGGALSFANTAEPLFTSNIAGVYIVTLEVRNEFNLTDTETVTITVIEGQATLYNGVAVVSSCANTSGTNLLIDGISKILEIGDIIKINNVPLNGGNNYYKFTLNAPSGNINFNQYITTNLIYRINSIGEIIQIQNC